MNDKNQAGFGIVALLAVVALITLAGGVGYFALTNNSDESTSDSEPIAADEQNSAPTARHDSTVKNDLQRILAELNSYAADNNGQFPTNTEEIMLFEQRYLAELAAHPTSELPYSLDETREGAYEYVVYRQGTCSEDGTIEEASSRRQIVLQIELPSGKTYCTGT